ncbi:MAG: hypothetical protein K2W96_04995, partial [Gemmataceae bacterium]|nr:hypothetical protein [Gemmataceae bacterium]
MRRQSVEGTPGPWGRLLARLALAVGLCALACWPAGRTASARPVVAAPPVKEEEPVKPPPEKAGPGKKYAFVMDGKPWAGVFRWVADQTGRPVVTLAKPKGAFTFTPPEGMTFAIGEVIDIINEGLLPQKIILINRGRNWAVASAEELPDLVPHLDDPDDLDDPKLGRDDIVAVTFTLKKAKAADVAADVEQQMGPFKKATAMEASNQVRLQDKVSTLRRLRKAIEAMDGSAKAGGPAETLSYRLKYITAADAEKQLKELMPPLPPGMAPPPPPPPVPATPPAGGKWSLGGKRPRVRPGMGGTPASGGQIGDVKVTVSDSTQTLHLTGTPEALARAKELLDTIDVKPSDGAREVARGDMVLKKHNVGAGAAYAVQMALMRDFPKANIQVVGNSTLIVYAYPQDQIKITKVILAHEEKQEEPKTVTIPVGDADPDKVAKFIMFSLGDFRGFQGGGLTVESAPEKNAVIVRGTPDQVKMAREIVAEFVGGGGDAGSEDTARVKTISLGEGSATAMADELSRLLPKLVKNPVEVVKPR